MTQTKKTFDQCQLEEFERSRRAKKEAARGKSIPTLLIEAAEREAAECRKEVLKLKAVVRKHPDKVFTGILLNQEIERQVFYDMVVKEMRDYYGKCNLIS